MIFLINYLYNNCLFLYLIMKSYTTIWYKDKLSKITYLTTWLLLLFMLNYSVILIIKDTMEMRQLLFFGLFGYLFYRLYSLFKYIRYEFSDEWIRIFQNKHRSYFLKVQDIEKIEMIDKLWLLNWFWVKHNYFTKETFFTTSISKIIKIYMKDWRVVNISPNKFDKNFLELIK